MSDLQQALADYPHLASPAHLAHADTSGKWQPAKHLIHLTRELMEAWRTPSARLQVNMQFQVGKTWLTSNYYPAWILLLWPETRIILASYGDDYAAKQGSKVKEIVERWGTPLGISLRKDTKAKDEWQIAGHDGGMVCRGAQGSITGRACDLMIIDDPIKDAKEALSPTILESRWDWYQSVIFGRLGPTAPVIIVMTRWSKNDLCGRTLQQAKKTGEKWKVIKYKALAEADDPLGRAPGEPLWPERQPLERLLEAREGNFWWMPCWQQTPKEEEGQYFHPRPTDKYSGWPTFLDLGDAYSLQQHGVARRIFLKTEIMVFVVVDWAWSLKQSADYSAIGAFGLTPDGRLLILEIVNRRLGVHELAPEIAGVCRRHRQALVAIEKGHPSLRDDCHKYPEIGEPRWLDADKDKLRRALPAIVMAENQKIYCPTPEPPWLDEALEQLKDFTGVNDDHDDIVDVFGNACNLAQGLRPTPLTREEWWPEALTEGKSNEW